VQLQTVRGRTVAVCICDEISWWMSEEHSANSDVEIIRALKPSMATIPLVAARRHLKSVREARALYEAHRAHFGKRTIPCSCGKRPRRR